MNYIFSGIKQSNSRTHRKRKTIRNADEKQLYELITLKQVP